MTRRRAKRIITFNIHEGGRTPLWYSPERGFQGKDEGGGRGPAMIKEGDMIDTTYRSPSCTEATNKIGKDHDTPIIVGSL